MKKKLSVLLIPVLIVALVGAIAFTGCKQIPESASQVETTAAETMAEETMAEETMAEETTAAAEETAAGGEMGIFLQAPGEIFKAKELAPPISEFKETYAAIDTYEHALTPEGEKVKIGFILPDMRVERSWSGLARHSRATWPMRCTCSAPEASHNAWIMRSRLSRSPARTRTFSSSW